MNKRHFWMIAVVLMTLVLVCGSCATEKTPTSPTTTVSPTVTPTTTVSPTVTPTTTATPTTPTTTAEKPRYGGTLTVVQVEPPYIDPCWSNDSQLADFSLVYERIGTGNWKKSYVPGGTSEFKFDHYAYLPEWVETGALAESWEKPDPQTMIVHLRKGVKFQNISPVNGREMTADDVLYTMNRVCTHPVGKAKSICPWLVLASCITLDKYTIQYKFKTPRFDMLSYVGAFNGITVHPREMVEKYGNLDDWRHACGTGPFMIADYTSGSSMLFEKNPDYWGYDEVNPQNQLPYVDNVKMLFITDLSTQLAALRTAKLDIRLNVNWEDAASLATTQPQLKRSQYLVTSSDPCIKFRCDLKPLTDVRVRRALLMCIDFDAIVDEYEGGNAVVHSWPMMPTWTDVYTPREQLPDYCKELYSYNVEKAKQLLVEAGYPNGFEAELFTGDTKYLTHGEIVSSYWSKLGIKTNIVLKERAVAEYMMYAGETKFGILRGSGQASPIGIFELYESDNAYNYAHGGDDKFDKMLDDIRGTFDLTERNKKFIEATHYAVGQAWVFHWPSKYMYSYWWPWVKNYQGEISLGLYQYGPLYARVWVDQEVKRTTKY